MEIPKTDCKGCQARDEMLKTLAEKVDEMAKALERRLTPVPKSSAMQGHRE